MAKQMSKPSAVVRIGLVPPPILHVGGEWVGYSPGLTYGRRGNSSNTTVLQIGYPILIVLACRGVRQYVLWDEPQ